LAPRAPKTSTISNRLKLQHLRVLMAVAEWGSMAKAAKHLAISQPVVSKVIADAEDMLGVRLFDRNPQGVEPTLYGRALLKRSIAIFDDLKASVEEIKFLADPTSGELLIGSTEPLAGLTAAVIDRLSRKYPRLVFRIVQADSATLLSRGLPERRIELAIVPLVGTSVSEELEATPLFHDRLRVVVGRRGRWGKRRQVTLADLVDEPWCVAPSSIGSLVTDAFLTDGLRMPRMAVVTTTAPIFLQLIESGRFIGHFGEGLLRFYADRFAVKTLPLELRIPPFAVAIVTLKNRTISPVAELFIDCAHEIAAPLARRESARDVRGKVRVAKTRKSGGG
jgi:DNA-binding transcriptional LysR family regulator